MIAAVNQLILTFVMLLVGIQSWVLMGCSVFGVVFYGAYVLIDLMYIIVPGALSFDDYILGALMLYIDLVRMLMHLLILLADAKK